MSYVNHPKQGSSGRGAKVRRGERKVTHAVVKKCQKRQESSSELLLEAHPFYWSGSSQNTDIALIRHSDRESCYVKCIFDAHVFICTLLFFIHTLFNKHLGAMLAVV